MSMGVSEMGKIRIKDMERTSNDKTSIMVMEFPFQLKRLNKYRGMFEKFMIHKIVIKCVGQAGSAEKGVVAYGILSGTKVDIKEMDQILALKPSKSHHVSMSSSVTITSDIQLGKWVSCDEANAFTLYTMTTAASTSLMEIYYDVTFASPVPF
jgi:hypothetical protein